MNACSDAAWKCPEKDPGPLVHSSTPTQPLPPQRGTTGWMNLSEVLTGTEAWGGKWLAQSSPLATQAGSPELLSPWPCSQSTAQLWCAPEEQNCSRSQHEASHSDCPSPQATCLPLSTPPALLNSRLSWQPPPCPHPSLQPGPHPVPLWAPLVLIPFPPSCHHTLPTKFSSLPSYTSLCHVLPSLQALPLAQTIIEL